MLGADRRSVAGASTSHVAKENNEAWTDKHRNVMRKWVPEGEWVQKRMYHAGWSDEKKCRGSGKGRRHGETQAAPLPVMERCQNSDPRAKCRDFEEILDMARHHVASSA